MPDDLFDGFFIARAVRTFWLRVSTGMRWLGVDRTLHWLPGVRKHPDREATLVIDTRLARWFALEVFHLLGFRRASKTKETLVVTPREHRRRRKR